jgi:cytochrome c556
MLRTSRLAAAALCLLLACPILAAAQSDPRQAAVRSESERLFILDQMRLFLSSIQAITADLATGDAAGVAAEAAARGRRANATLSLPPGLGAKETPAWKTMMGGARNGFDGLSDLARAGAPTPRLLASLAETMSNCVACHQTYHLVVAGE